VVKKTIGYIMIQKVFEMVVIFLILFFYSHLYLHFIVNPNNECSIVTHLTREEISGEVYTKQPFLLDATLFRKDTESIDYESIPLLEPFVKFYPHRSWIPCPMKHKWIETNASCRTFYRVDKGSFHVTCIHPLNKINKDLKPSKKWKKNKDCIQLVLHEDSMLFLPKDWCIFVEALEDSKLDKIQYYTPLNVLANSILGIYKYLRGSIYICSTKEPPFIL